MKRDDLVADDRGPHFVPLDAVPGGDWTVFRSEMLQIPDPDFRALLDRAYSQAVQRSLTWFSSRPSVEPEVTLDQVQSLLGTLGDGLSPGLEIVVIRGCQAGAFLAGWHLKVNARQLMARMGGDSYYPQWNDAIAQGLSRIRGPFLPAVASALLTEGIDLSDLVAMKLGDVEAREGHLIIHTKSGTHEVPREADVYLRAYLHWLSEATPDSSSPLWVNESGTQLKRGAFRNVLFLLSLLTGAPFSNFNRRSQPKHELQRYGFALSKLRL